MTVTDPVCGMKIERRDAVAPAEFQGRTCYFCCEDCKETFQEDPAEYADEA